MSPKQTTTYDTFTFESMRRGRRSSHGDREAVVVGPSVEPSLVLTRLSPYW